MGSKDSRGLGQPTRECWPEVWHINEPIYQKVWQGETPTLVDQLFPITRHGYLEQAWFTVFYSPLRDDQSSIAGILVAAIEATPRVIAEQEQGNALRNSEARFRALVNASSDVLYRMDPTWSEMRDLSSAGFLTQTENPRSNWLEEYIPESDRAQVLQEIQRARDTKSMFELEHRVRRADGTLGWTLSRAVPLLNAEGEIAEWFGAANDITLRRQAEEKLKVSLAERDALLKEVHHRVKNNLQVITSLLEMQADGIDDPRAFNSFQDTHNRVASLAKMHELLYRSGRFAEVQLATYTRELADFIVAFYRADHLIRVEVTGEEITLELERAVPCGLILNELVSNACKHAFPGGRSGSIQILLAEKGSTLSITVADNGIGLPEHLHHGEASTLGMKLVRALTEQLRATLLISEGTIGTAITIEMPKQSVSETPGSLS